MANFTYKYELGLPERRYNMSGHTYFISNSKNDQVISCWVWYEDKEVVRAEAERVVGTLNKREWSLNRENVKMKASSMKSSNI